MSNNSLLIYIPHIFSGANWREFGGTKGMKKHIRKVLLNGKIPDGIKIGIAKKIDIIENKTSQKMMPDFAAFVRIVPIITPESEAVLSHIRKKGNYRLVYDNENGYFWDLLLSNKNIECSYVDKEVQTDSVIIVEITTLLSQDQKSDKTNKNNKNNSNLTDLFENLTCQDGPSRKRLRLKN